MRLLVLGGTAFLGRAVVAAALARGDEVTLFTRGRTNPDLFPEAEHLRGDRDGDLSALAGRTWDGVIDTSGYVPRVVGESVRLLADSVSHYTFVSTMSVYADASHRQREGDRLEELEDPATEDVMAHYGGLKAACERVVGEAFSGRSLLVRPGLIVGPHDPTNRFTYWVRRTAEGGDVLAPGDPDRQVQFIDVRDLAEWMLRATEGALDGPFNAVGPKPPVTMGGLLEACVRAGGSDARLVWVDDAFLLEHEVGEWMELPLWVAAPEWAGLLDADIERAVRAGLTFRPVDETVRDTLDWARSADGTTRPGGPPRLPAGLEAAREQELLAQWRASDRTA